MESLEDVQKNIYKPKKGPPMLPLHGRKDVQFRPRRKRRKVDKSQSHWIPPKPKDIPLSNFPASTLPEGFPPEFAFRALAAYSFLRTVSTELRLSPFTPNVFLRALYLPYPNKLLGQIHTSLLRILLSTLNMGYSCKPKGNSTPEIVLKKRRVDGIRWPLRAGDNLTFLDSFSWPLFYDDYVHLTADVLWSFLNDQENHADFRTIGLPDTTGMVLEQDLIEQEEEKSLMAPARMPNRTALEDNYYLTETRGRGSRSARRSRRATYTAPDDDDDENSDDESFKEAEDEVEDDSDDEDYMTSLRSKQSTRKRGRPRTMRSLPKHTPAIMEQKQVRSVADQRLIDVQTPFGFSGHGPIPLPGLPMVQSHFPGPMANNLYRGSPYQTPHQLPLHSSQASLPTSMSQFKQEMPSAAKTLDNGDANAKRSPRRLPMHKGGKPPTKRLKATPGEAEDGSSSSNGMAKSFQQEGQVIHNAQMDAMMQQAAIVAMQHGLRGVPNLAAANQQSPLQYPVNNAMYGGNFLSKNHGIVQSGLKYNSKSNTADRFYPQSMRSPTVPQSAQKDKKGMVSGEDSDVLRDFIGGKYFKAKPRNGDGATTKVHDIVVNASSTQSWYGNFASIGSTSKHEDDSNGEKSSMNSFAEPSHDDSGNISFGIVDDQSTTNKDERRGLASTIQNEEQRAAATTSQPMSETTATHGHRPEIYKSESEPLSKQGINETLNHCDKTDAVDIVASSGIESKGMKTLTESKPNTVGEIPILHPDTKTSSSEENRKEDFFSKTTGQEIKNSYSSWVGRNGEETTCRNEDFTISSSKPEESGFPISCIAEVTSVKRQPPLTFSRKDAANHDRASLSSSDSMLANLNEEESRGNLAKFDVMMIRNDANGNDAKSVALKPVERQTQVNESTETATKHVGTGADMERKQARTVDEMKRTGMISQHQSSKTSAKSVDDYAVERTTTLQSKLAPEFNNGYKKEVILLKSELQSPENSTPISGMIVDAKNKMKSTGTDKSTIVGRINRDSSVGTMDDTAKQSFFLRSDSMEKATSSSTKTAVPIVSKSMRRNSMEDDSESDKTYELSRKHRQVEKDCESTITTSRDESISFADHKDNWPQFRPVKIMRSGIPYHRLPLDEKLTVLEFLIDELLTIDTFAAECSKRNITSYASTPYGCLPFESELENMENDDECAVCKGEGDLLCCDGCLASYHKTCIDMKLNDELPEGRWLCPECELVDPAKFGPLKGGKKACLDWFCVEDMQIAEHLRRAGYKSKQRDDMGQEMNDTERPQTHSVLEEDAGNGLWPDGGEQRVRSGMPHLETARELSQMSRFDQPEQNPAAVSSVANSASNYVTEGLKSTSLEGCAHVLASKNAIGEQLRQTLFYGEEPQSTSKSLDQKMPQNESQVLSTSEDRPTAKSEVYLDHEFLVVHGFIFCRSRTKTRNNHAPSSVFESDPILPMSSEDLSKVLKSLGPELSLSWPLAQIPFLALENGGSVVKRSVVHPKVHTYFTSKASYDPSFYQSKYRKAPLSKILFPGSTFQSIQLLNSEYENACNTCHLRRISDRLTPHFLGDQSLVLSLKLCTNLFDPYQLIKDYMLKLEGILNRANLLDEFWGTRNKEIKANVWQSNVRLCQSIPRLASLLLKLIDSTHRRAFSEQWFLIAGHKESSDHVSEVAETVDLKSLQPLTSDWRPEAERRKHRWERAPLASIRSVLAKEGRTIEDWVYGENRRFLRNASPNRRKRKYTPTGRQGYSPNKISCITGSVGKKSVGDQESSLSARSVAGEAANVDPAILSVQKLQQVIDKRVTTGIAGDKKTNDEKTTDNATANRTTEASEESASKQTKGNRRNRTRRSSRVTKKQETPEDFLNSVIHSSGKTQSELSMETLIEAQKMAKLVEVKEEASAAPFIDHVRWPVCGRKFFDPIGNLSATEMKRLGRNGGGIMAQNVSYTGTYEVGEVSHFHVWRKNLQRCTSYEQLLMQIRIVESYLERNVIQSCETLAKRTPLAKSSVPRVIMCMQRDLLTGIDHHYVVHKAKNRGCWISSQAIDLSPFILERSERREKRVKLFRSKLRAKEMAEMKAKEAARAQAEAEARARAAEYHRQQEAARQQAMREQAAAREKAQREKEEAKAARDRARAKEKAEKDANATNLQSVKQRMQRALHEHKMAAAKLIQQAANAGLTTVPEPEIQSLRKRTFTILQQYCNLLGKRSDSRALAKQVQRVEYEALSMTTQTSKNAVAPSSSHSDASQNNHPDHQGNPPAALHHHIGGVQAAVPYSHPEGNANQGISNPVQILQSSSHTVPSSQQTMPPPSQKAKIRQTNGHLAPYPGSQEHVRSGHNSYAAPLGMNPTIPTYGSEWQQQLAGRPNPHPEQRANQLVQLLPGNQHNTTHNMRGGSGAWANQSSRQSIQGIQNDQLERGGVLLRGGCTPVQDNVPTSARQQPRDSRFQSISAQQYHEFLARHGYGGSFPVNTITGSIPENLYSNTGNAHIVQQQNEPQYSQNVMYNSANSNYGHNMQMQQDGTLLDFEPTPIEQMTQQRPYYPNAHPRQQVPQQRYSPAQFQQPQQQTLQPRHQQHPWFQR